MITTEIGVRGLNAAYGTKLFFSEVHTLDLVNTLQALRRNNRYNQVTDKVYMFYSRATMDKFLKENKDLLKFMRARWESEFKQSPTKDRKSELKNLISMAKEYGVAGKKKKDLTDPRGYCLGP